MSRNYEKARQIESDLQEEQIADLAFRKFINELADTTTDEEQAEVEDVGLLEATYRGLDRLESLEQSLHELEEENDDLRNRLDKLGDIGQEKTSKEQKVAAIVTYAENSRGNGDEAVTVLPKTIKGLVDVSRRYCYDIVDDMVETYDWAHDPAEISQYGSVEKDTPQKGVCIDFEGVHGEPVPVNKFTTRSDGQGVSA